MALIRNIVWTWRRQHFSTKFPNGKSDLVLNIDFTELIMPIDYVLIVETWSWQNHNQPRAGNAPSDQLDFR